MQTKATVQQVAGMMEHVARYPGDVASRTAATQQRLDSLHSHIDIKDKERAAAFEKFAKGYTETEWWARIGSRRFWATS